MSHARLIDQYLAGPRQLEQAIQGMTSEQLDAAPIPGRWSTHQVICHIADFEVVNLDRMKRVIAEVGPTLFGGDPDRFESRLAYRQREIEVELRLIETVRRHMAPVLRSLSEADFERIGQHSEDGPLTLRDLLQRTTGHIPHHLHFIEEKRQALEI